MGGKEEMDENKVWVGWTSAVAGWGSVGLELVGEVVKVCFRVVKDSCWCESVLCQD